MANCAPTPPQSIFNDELPSGHVVLARESRWNENDGDTEWAWIWSGSSVYTQCFQSGYKFYHVYIIDATDFEREQACHWYRHNSRPGKSLKGCTVILKGSRKAPNKVHLDVVDCADAYFDKYSYRHQPAMVKVKGQNIDPVWVSQSCVNEIVTVPAPWWAKE